MLLIEQICFLLYSINVFLMLVLKLLNFICEFNGNDKVSKFKSFGLANVFIAMMVRVFFLFCHFFHLSVFLCYFASCLFLSFYFGFTLHWIAFWIFFIPWIAHTFASDRERYVLRVCVCMYVCWNFLHLSFRPTHTFINGYGYTFNAVFDDTKRKPALCFGFKFNKSSSFFTVFLVVGRLVFAIKIILLIYSFHRIFINFQRFSVNRVFSLLNEVTSRTLLYGNDFCVRLCICVHAALGRFQDLRNL